MEYYIPNPTATGRYCAACGAAWRLHAPTGALDEWGEPLRACPVRYRPGSIDAAVAHLREATTAGDRSRVFVARGDVQRLMDHRPGICQPLCAGCEALLASTRLAMGGTDG